MNQLTLTLGEREAEVEIHTAIVAGWTGRDQAAVERHIAELEELGVPRPSAAPIFYRVSASRITTAEEIESTQASSGEVEPVLLRAAGELWLGVGSDHTDREVETYSVAVSKELCEKPVAPKFWAFQDVASHWDQLIVRAWILEHGEEVLYQEGRLDAMQRAEDLVSAAEPALVDGTVMFCGTFPAVGGIRVAERFRYELEDAVLERSISGGYRVRDLPMVS